MTIDEYGEAARNAAEQVDAPIKPVDTSSWPFQCLGYDRDRFYLYHQEGKQVLAYTARALHSGADLAVLAPIQWFEMTFQGKQGADLRQAGNEIIRACYRAGIYDPEAIRGRGVWMDEGRVVLHLGDRLWVDGAPVALHEHLSEFIYERAAAMGISPGTPLSDEDGRRLLAMIEQVAWVSPERDSRILLGWVVSSIICGALPWRPHVWITSNGGGGKTWVLDNIVALLLGPVAHYFEGATTATGILGEVRRDSRPVVFEEAETQTVPDRDRMQAVLNLARSASSSSRSKVAKGTQDGGSRSASMRGSFLFASINSGVTQAADERRIVPVSLAGGNPEQFKALKAAHGEVASPALAGQFLARIIGMIPTILHNIDELSTAITKTGVGREIGDTLGTLVGCSLAVVSSDRLTPERAEQFVEARPWLQQAAQEAVVVPEHERALAHLLQAEGARINDGGRVYGVPVGELIEKVTTRAENGAIRGQDADDILKRHGIKVDRREGRLVLFNQSTFIGTAFANTPWGAGWRTTLMRITGAQNETSVRFSGAMRGRSISLPLDGVLGSGEI